MVNVQNWAAVKRRSMDFWNHTLKGRALLNLRCPMDHPEQVTEYPNPRPAENLEDQWLNSERIRYNLLHGAYRTRFLAEGYPERFVNLGPGFLAAMIGGSYKLAKDTVWFDNGPVVEDYDRDLDKVRMYPDCDAYKLVTGMTRYFASASQGQYMTSITDLGGTLDVAASLRGNLNLLYDILDQPEGVLALTERIDALWIEAYQTLYDILKPYQEGVDTWHNLYCDKSYYTLQCDFCAMLSPEQFDTFVLPSLRRHCDWLSYAEYHLDGPDCVRHVPSLLSIPNLDAIQWVPGDGAAPYCDEGWFPMYRQIQDAGKNLILVGLTPEEALRFLGELDQTRLFLQVSCKDEREAENILNFAEKHA